MTGATITLSMLAAILLGSLAAMQEPKQAVLDANPEDLVGGYTIISGEKFGSAEPEDRIEGTTVRWTRDRVVVADKEKKEVYAATYKLDAKSTPWRITMTSKLPDSEQTVEGLVEKEGDVVRLIYALPGAEAPKEFKTRDQQLMFVMKNMNKGEGGR